MNRTFLTIWAVATLGVGGAAWWYLFSAGSVPPGHMPLADEAAFREAFQKGVAKNRIVALVSPTTPADLVMVQGLQSLLTEYENDTLDAHVIWQQMVQTDWAPTTDAMARVWDVRARHYWDKKRALRAALGEGRILIYARGAGLEAPALRISDWERDLPKVREFLGTPKKMQLQ